MFSVLSFTPPRTAPTFRIRTQFATVDAVAPAPELHRVSSPKDFAGTIAAHEVGMVGALSFDGRTASLARTPGLSPKLGLPANGEARVHAWPRRIGQPVLSPSADGYRDGVRAVLRAVDEQRVVKAVLGRTVEHRFDGPVPVVTLTEALERCHPEARTYRCPLPGGDVLVGASPELLVSRHGTTVRSHPLAGSAPRNPDPTLDEQAAQGLLRSEKDRREHAVVVEAIADTLAPYCSRLTVPREPALVSTWTMWHLGTRLCGELRDPSTSSLELALALQPTPALCGTPQQAAQQLLQELEPFNRQWFGGAVGWNDAQGNGEWTVAIRCAQLSGNKATLFAGAGLVAGSDPEAEFVETSRKLASLEDVLLAESDWQLEGRSA